MNIVKNLSFASAALSLLAVPAFAGVTIASPTAGESVGSTFTLSANAATCSDQQVGTMAYSLDSSSNDVVANGNSISQTVSATAGSHTVHVKAWGVNGATCITDVVVSVNGPVVAAAANATPAVAATAASSPLSAPSGATRVSSLQVMKSWSAQHDAGTTGSSSGSMSLAGSPSKSGNARRFVTHFSNYGGERYHISIGDDVNAQNFLYDAWVYMQNSASTVTNLEMDLNQVIANGWTVIFGFQCDHWSKTWDYTMNKGTASKPNDAWIHSGAHCDASTWAQNTWHHVQISYSRDSSGYVTYKSVALDGAVQSINKRVFSGFNLHWGKTLLANVQIDGAKGSGSSTVYLDEMAISRW